MFEDKKFEDYVYYLFNALYGLKKVPQTWYDILFKFLLENNFTRGVVGKTFFHKKHKNYIVMVQVYVDNFIFVSTND